MTILEAVFEKPIDAAIIKGMSEGRNMKTIAAQESTSYSYVQNRCEYIRKRFGATSNEHLMAILFRAGVLK